MESMEPFGRWLKRRMDELLVGVVRLSQELEVSEITVYRWINNQGVPTAENRKRLAQALQVDELELLHRMGMAPNLNEWPADVRALAEHLMQMTPEERRAIFDLLQTFRPCEPKPKAKPAYAQVRAF